MTENRVQIRIVIETNHSGRLTKVEQWDIVTAAAVAVRAAIEQYVAPSQRKHACAAVANVIRDEVPESVFYAETKVESPFEPEPQL